MMIMTIYTTAAVTLRAYLIHTRHFIRVLSVRTVLLSGFDVILILRIRKWMIRAF